MKYNSKYTVLITAEPFSGFGVLSYAWYVINYVPVIVVSMIKYDKKKTLIIFCLFWNFERRCSQAESLI